MFDVPVPVQHARDWNEEFQTIVGSFEDDTILDEEAKFVRLSALAQDFLAIAKETGTGWWTAVFLSLVSFVSVSLFPSLCSLSVFILRLHHVDVAVDTCPRGSSCVSGFVSVSILIRHM